MSWEWKEKTGSGDKDQKAVEFCFHTEFLSGLKGGIVLFFCKDCASLQDRFHLQPTLGGLILATAAEQVISHKRITISVKTDVA